MLIYLSQSVESELEGQPNRENDETDLTAFHPIENALISQQPLDQALPAETGINKVVNMLTEAPDSNEQPDSVNPPHITQMATSFKRIARTDGLAPMILIVEDAMELAEIIQATLERMNLRTVHETHGEKALGKLDSVKPDLILLDIALPDITGWKFLDELKAKYSKNDMPIVIVMTAYGDPANRLVGKLQGIHSYIIKPIKPDELEDMVNKVLA